jgi:hypothetical protein
MLRAKVLVDGDAVDGLRPSTAWGSKGEHRERSEQAVPPFMTETLVFLDIEQEPDQIYRRK